MKKYAITSDVVKVKKLIPGGQGIGQLSDGKKVFLWNVLPNENVTKWQITKIKSHYVEGIALEIQQPSPYRIKPQDDCFLSTSPWQNMDYQYELEQKQEILLDTFRQEKIEFKRQERNDSQVFDLDVSQVQSDDKEFAYRNKMEYSLYYNNDTAKIELAFHQRGSHRKIPITKSSLEKPEIWQRAQEIITKLNRNHEEARKYQSLLLRCNRREEVSGGLFENGKPHPKFKNLEDEIFGEKYSYSPNGFFQINLPVYEMALLRIQKYIKTEKVLDLYAGVGTIGLSVAKNKELVLVECNQDAYTEMKKNCIGKTWAKPILAKSEEALEYIEPEETVILDPPRAGCDQKLIEKLLENQPETIIYLSCNPSTQARDTKMLIEDSSYAIANVTPFNFFPRTPHLENLVTLERNK